MGFSLSGRANVKPFPEKEEEPAPKQAVAEPAPEPVKETANKEPVKAPTKPAAKGKKK
jgi:hypothetical protein